MLAVINRYKVFFIIIALIVLAVLSWLLLSTRGSSKIPSKGVFVLRCQQEIKCQEGGTA
ncbi:MAG: hypothetical protein GX279_02440 [Clostridiaceae bacterium]|nr:hypothetical protein [Clostridiaceae bacterium]